MNQTEIKNPKMEDNRPPSLEALVASVRKFRPPSFMLIF
jgi:hypothetical protein